MKLIIFEDSLTDNLRPFSFNHASFELKVGLFTNLERFVSNFREHEIYLVVRKEIEDVVRYRFPNFNINPNIIPEAQCINGKVVWENKYSDLLNIENLLCFKNNREISLNEFYSKIKNFDNTTKLNDFDKHINYLWDCIDIFSDKLEQDFSNFKIDPIENVSAVHLINKEFILIKDNVNIKPGVIIDASNGPVYINTNSIIDSGAIIQGPVFIDKDSYISPGSKIRSGTLIGPSCKIGGEVSNSIIYAKSNKVHDGFLGHSFVGEWVNIGAGTNNSNLKNNYNSIKFNFGDKTIDTNKIFLGMMVGDFTRIAISTSINTGTFIGIGANIFNHDFNSKFVHSFSWGSKEKVDFIKFIDTCKKMFSRRNIELHKTEQKLLEYLYHNI